MSCALITGASAGIGKALAACFAQQGYDLIVVARNKSRLAEAAAELADGYDVRVDAVAADLAEPEAAGALYGETQELQQKVDVLVNNAAAMEMHHFSDTEPAKVEQLMTLNMSTLVMLTRLFLPDMLTQAKGHILNISSLAAFQPMPGMACYAASKAFVLSFTEALAEELKGTGVLATVLCPGFTNTDMASAGLEKLRAEFGNLPDLFMAEPASVARAGYDACMKGTVVEVPGLANKALSLWSQTQPRWLLRKLAGASSRIWSRETSSRQAE